MQEDESEEEEEEEESEDEEEEESSLSKALDDVHVGKAAARQLSKKHRALVRCQPHAAHNEGESLWKSHPTPTLLCDQRDSHDGTSILCITEVLTD